MLRLSAHNSRQDCLNPRRGSVGVVREDLAPVFLKAEGGRLNVPFEVDGKIYKLTEEWATLAA
jgi:hypothetical protein